ncbi:unnamed protein product [Symbiodinium necroappetens]|uniref:3-deoxy-D-manno-octulosonate 8-phosphate phosphatase KdsC n=1 Tax=Symbiodinium necroappetens TaxID=1628268 RepID=A0A812KH74_9DINO|nr:unnamed protein product [Symbiodinium necroappetens]
MPNPFTGKTIRAVITDVDGCLTDGRVGFTSNGDSVRHFHTHDGLGTQLLIQAGIHVAWLSAGSKPESIFARAQTIGVEHVDVNRDEKGQRFLDLCAKLGVDPAHTVYMGDDLKDLPAMAHAAISACPADAVKQVRDAAHLTLTRNGGHGAFRELADLILEAR